MDPNPGTHPILSYVMSRLQSLSPKARSQSKREFDVEKPHSPSSLSSPSAIVGQMPNLIDPKIISAMTRAISDVSQARSVLKQIGDRPTHEEIDIAKAKLIDLDVQLSRQMEEIATLQRPPEIDEQQWQIHITERETKCRESIDNERRIYKSLLQKDEMFDAYEKLLKNAESRLVKIYEDDGDVGESSNGGDVAEDGECHESIARILLEAREKDIDRVELVGKRLRKLPEEFCNIDSLLVLNLNTNQLSVIPDTIAALQNLEELNISSNLLESLSDSIGLLQKLKILNVSGNKLSSLPDSISQCRSLVELDASFNSLTYLPTNIGYELQNLQKLLVGLNKIRSLPSSVCEMKSLRYLDARFNELHGLPIAIGKLTSLEVLNLSNNFSDLQELPETFGDLSSLRELDLSNNQIQALPDTFGRLDSLTKLNLDQNPIELPPMEVVNEGILAIKSYMSERWLDILAEEEKKNTHELQEGQSGWVTRSTSWLKNVSENVTEYIGNTMSPKSARSPKSPITPRTPKSNYLDQPL
ncbi:plant intracellular Ras-group-related LRR protein 1-like [Trifolium pratense]|uniref:plant intracellular Ras-group-related LRR protein 1-like n=1 Tax=Trifolium pratense TaxID=57577 RepID=UPI001E691B06|nr:plant intracellular Ras-group-related LRR protein 1-like [Trifolium pratense]